MRPPIARLSRRRATRRRAPALSQQRADDHSPPLRAAALVRVPALAVLADGALGLELGEDPVEVVRVAHLQLAGQLAHLDPGVLANDFERLVGRAAAAARPSAAGAPGARSPACGPIHAVESRLGLL